MHRLAALARETHTLQRVQDILLRLQFPHESEADGVMGDRPGATDRGALAGEGSGRLHEPAVVDAVAGGDDPALRHARRTVQVRIGPADGEKGIAEAEVAAMQELHE